MELNENWRTDVTPGILDWTGSELFIPSAPRQPWNSACMIGWCIYSNGGETLALEFMDYHRWIMFRRGSKNCLNFMSGDFPHMKFNIKERWSIMGIHCRCENAFRAYNNPNTIVRSSHVSLKWNAMWRASLHFWVGNYSRSITIDVKKLSSHGWWSSSN